MSMRSLPLLFLVPFTLLAQAPLAPLAAPPADHPDLYYAFFTKGPQGQSGPAISTQDSVKVNSVSAGVANDLGVIDRHLQAYLAQAKLKGAQPNATTLQAFDAARGLASLRGAQQLRQSVSPQGWRDFHTWINGPFRASLGGH
jgi:hypothetical protein